MKTALCFTPDLAFFPAAVFTAASTLAHPDADAFDIFIVCEARDVAPEFARLDPSLRNRIHLLTVDFSPFDAGMRESGRFTRAVFRRLFLDSVLPETYRRIISIDADMWVARPGLGRLADLNLRGHALGAAYDMIFLMDQRGGALARQFQDYRASLGLDVSTPYFNAGLMVIDREVWRAQELTARASRALRETPDRFPFMEQSALNSLLRGQFAPLSPRYNFMGDFLLIDLERQLLPIVMHFVNTPKPWHDPDWRGERRFSRIYRDWFGQSPWPKWAEGEQGGLLGRPAATPARQYFAQGLRAFLASREFIDIDRKAISSLLGLNPN